MSGRNFLSRSPEETFSIGRALGKSLKFPTILTFSGDLGAGKTALIKGLAAGALGVDPREVVSPTFTYLNIYTLSEKSLFHFDLYRLRTAEDFLGMGFDEYFDKGGLCCIEWPERITELLPPSCIKIEIAIKNHEQREISIS